MTAQQHETGLLRCPVTGGICEEEMKELLQGPWHFSFNSLDVTRTLASQHLRTLRSSPPASPISVTFLNAAARSATISPSPPTASHPPAVFSATSRALNLNNSSNAAPRSSDKCGRCSLLAPPHPTTRIVITHSASRLTD